MAQRRLASTKRPRSATEAFKKVSEILNAGVWVFPEEGKYNGSGAPGRYLEDLLGIDENNADSPDLADWEIKFHGGTALLTLFHKDPEPKGIIVVEGEVLKNPRRVIYREATAYWEPDIKGFTKAIADGVFCVDFDARTQKGMGSAIRNHGTKFRIKIDDLSRVYANKIKITTGLG